MSDFVKKVVNSVAVQTAAFAVTEGGKVLWPKVKEAFNKAMNKADDVVKTTKTKSEFEETIKNTKNEFQRVIAEKKRKTPVADEPTTKVFDATFKS